MVLARPVQKNFKTLMSFSKHVSTYDAYCQIQKRAFSFLLPSFDQLSDLAYCADVGCGTGLQTQLVAQTHPRLHIDALDNSLEMVTYARKMHSEPNIRYRCQDVLTWEPSAQYDLIFSNATFQWMSDPSAVFSKVNSALKPGAKLVFTAFGPETFQELQKSIGMTLGPVRLQAQQFEWVSKLTRFLPEALTPILFERHRIVTYYDSLFSLLRSISYSGTSRPTGGAPLFSHMNTVKTVESVYREYYGGIKTTHDIFFCECTKK